MKAIPKNRTQEIRVCQREFKARRFLDIRQFFRAEDGQVKPTGKGVTLSVDLAGDLAGAIRAVAAQERPDAD